MKKILFADSFEWDGEKIIQNWYEFDPADTKEYGVARLYVLKGQSLLLAEKYNGTFQIPGGHIEGEESPESTAVRELLEEVNAEVAEDNLIPVSILESYKESDSGHKTYEVHFAINADKVKFNPFEADPGEKIVGSKFANLSELDDFLKWGKKAEFIGKFLTGCISRGKITL